MIKQHQIGIISDTHGLLREEVIEHLKQCEFIIHAGDINKQEIIDQLEAIAPLIVVRGNNDKGEWAEALPLSKKITLGSLKFFVVHNKKDIPKDLEDTNIVVFGHSHKYTKQQIDGVTYINPGSCGKRRFDLPITMAILSYTDEGTFNIEQVDLVRHDS